MQALMLSNTEWNKLTPKICSPKMLHPHMLSHSVWLFATPWTLAHQAPLSMGTLQARILEWVAMPSSRGSTQPRERTQVSSIIGGFFIVWATKEAQEYWGGLPNPSPEELSDPGIEPGSPALQADSLPSEPPKKPKNTGVGSLSLLQGIFLT